MLCLSLEDAVVIKGTCYFHNPVCESLISEIIPTYANMPTHGSLLIRYQCHA